MGDGSRAEIEAYGPTEDQDQQQFEAEVQQWEREERELAFIEKVKKAREFSDWWQTLDKDTDYIREHDDASNGHS
jgi:hypothetical protein